MAALPGSRFLQEERCKLSLEKCQAFGGAIERGVGGMLRGFELCEIFFGVPVVQGEVAVRAGKIPEEARLTEVRIELKQAGPVAVGAID